MDRMVIETEVHKDKNDEKEDEAKETVVDVDMMEVEDIATDRGGC